MNDPAATGQDDRNIAARTVSLLKLANSRNYQKVDRLFMFLMFVQWIVAIALSIWVSPTTWIGSEWEVHVHVWAAVFLGGGISSAPILMAFLFPGAKLTRHLIAISQGLWGALLIHLSGGRLETHFHIFGSLAIIAFYRDWKVIVTMTIVVAADHAVRGIWWPISVYGVALESPFRWLEHAAWVVFEDIFLISACLRGQSETRTMCLRQAELEHLNREVENKVLTRTRELEVAREKAEQLALVARYTDNSVLILDESGQVEWVNEGFTRITGYSMHEVKGRIPIDVLRSENTDPEHIQKIYDGLKKKLPFDLEVQKRRKDGREIIVAIEARTIQDSDGNVTKFVQLERDITARAKERRKLRRLTTELKKSAEHLKKLALVAQYTSNAVVISNDEGLVEWVNDGFTRITGYTLADCVGKNPSSLLYGELTDASVARQIGESVRAFKHFRGELINYHKDGTPYWIEIEISPVKGEEGELNRIIGVVSDISDRKEAEAEKDQLAKQLQDAARHAGMAEVATDVLHNVGNVLNSANVSVKLLGAELKSSTMLQLEKASEVIDENRSDLHQFLSRDPRGKRFPEFFQKAVEKLKEERENELKEVNELTKCIEHINTIVSMQQDFAGKGGGSTEVVEPSAVVADALKLCQASFSRHNVQLEQNLIEVPPISMEKNQVLQILANLIKNAKDAVSENSPTNRKVKIALRQSDNVLQFEVSDNGVGICSENLTSIFQHGFSTKPNGNGFGLHSAANAAQEMGGNLSVSSSGPGQGATFTLEIPLTENHQCLV